MPDIVRQTCEICGSKIAYRRLTFPVRDSHPDFMCPVCGNIVIPARRGVTVEYLFEAIQERGQGSKDS